MGLAFILITHSNREVQCVWDGAARSKVDNVWLSQSGCIMLGEDDEPIYRDEDRPHGAPLEKDNPYWEYGE